MIQESDKKVVGIGEILWDILPDGKKMGGAPANFAYHVSQFGLDGCVASAIGDDRLGTELMTCVEDKRLDAMLPVVEYPTGAVHVTVDEMGVPTYDIKENVAWDNIPFSDDLRALAAETSAVCFGSLAQRNIVSRDTIHRFLDAMPVGKDVYRIFDINLRQGFYTPEIIHDSLTRCNILKINDEELVIISRLFGYPGIDLQDKCWILLGKYNLEMLILTCGINGSYVFVPGSVSFVPTPKVNVADTVGAGDSFTATFVSSILSGMSVEDAHRLAVEVSAYVCTQAGAMPCIPKELIDKIKNIR
ncbi:MAG: carbohydrate kinase [Paenibacillus sp.]|nr:carbohydrate kinase [Paenibacillus sp.]